MEKLPQAMNRLRTLLISEITSAFSNVSRKGGVSLRETKVLDNYLRSAKLRAQSELLDAADLIYRYDWACVNARLKGESAPSGLEPGVVKERHYTLNWLIGYGDEPWDNVSTNT